MQLLAYKLFLDIDLMEENREVGGKASVDSRLLDEPLALTRWKKSFECKGFLDCKNIKG